MRKPDLEAGSKVFYRSPVTGKYKPGLVLGFSLRKREQYAIQDRISGIRRSVASNDILTGWEEMGEEFWNNPENFATWAYGLSRPAASKEDLFTTADGELEDELEWHGFPDEDASLLDNDERAS